MSPLQRKAVQEAKELVEETIGILEGFGGESSPKGLVSAGVKLAKVVGWLNVSLGGNSKKE